MHAVPAITQECDQRPERILLIHVHEKESCDLTHTLAVSNLRVVHRIGCQHVEQRLLLDVVSFAEHDVVSVGPVDV